MNSQRIRAGAVLISVFALGAVGGVFLDRHHLLPEPQPAVLSPEALHGAAMAELRDALQLDDEQMTQIHAILGRNQHEVQRAWEVLRPEVQAAMQTVHEEIATVLRPDQLGLYHDWLGEQQARHQQTPALLPGRH